jgi:NDP-sugar pyrophosphorylase family protein
MKLAIIGAGEGSRLREVGVLVPKPLVKISGIPLIERIIRLAVRNGITSVHIIINDSFGEVKAYLDSIDVGVPVDCELRSTPSSMHTLFALAPKLRDAPFCMTTVDSVFREDEFARFHSCCEAERRADGVLAVTGFIDDEKPLCVIVDEEQRITGFLDHQGDSKLATGGIYYFRPSIFDEIPKALDTGISRLRNFLRLLVERNYVLKAFAFSKIIDVDHAKDIVEAEKFLRDGS